MIKIYINYQVRQDPWGGINSFMKAFIDNLSNREDVVIFKEPKLDQIDIYFQGAATNGGDIDLEVRDFESVLEQRSSNNFKFVLRLDGLRAVYSTNPVPSDYVQIELAKRADNIVFQSKASLEQFRKFDYSSDNYTIIYNGVNQSLFYPREKVVDSYDNKDKGNTEGYSKKLKIMAASWSNSPRKGFATISEISRVPGVEVTFVGRWDPNTPLNNVNVFEAVPQEKLASIYRENDVFLHAAENDPCPNVVLEALSSGLPIIYNNTGGTVELAKGYGLPIEGNTLDYYRILIDQIIESYANLRGKIIQDINKFSIEQVTNQYLDYFYSIIR